MTRPKRRLSANRGEIKRDGLQVTPFYDPLLAKIMVHGGDRQEAIRRLADLLARVEIVGLKTNLPVLQRIVADPAFRAGDLSTAFLAQRLGISA